jgi:hypothetical protein
MWRMIREGLATTTTTIILSASWQTKIN